MSKFTASYARFTGVRTGLTGLPSWARTVFAIALLPEIVLVGLSIVVLLISIAALLLVAVPVYTLLRALTRVEMDDSSGLVQASPVLHGEVKHVDSVVRDADSVVPEEADSE